MGASPRQPTTPSRPPGDPPLPTTPAVGSPGGLPRQAFSGPSLFTLDASLFKLSSLTAIREGMAIQFRAEFFNVLNQVAFQAPPGTNLNIISGSFGQLNSAYPARIGQLALKVTF